MSASKKKYGIFISYRRDGGEYTAKILRDKLEDLGYTVFFDVESLRSGNFNKELYSVIENCRDFLLILSPNALDRCKDENDWVRCEIEKALQCEKNVVPVLLRGFTYPEDLPASICDVRYKNGLEANSQFFDAFIEKLQDFLVTKPPFFQRLRKNPVFKRVIPTIITLLLAFALGLGAYVIWDHSRAVFPRTSVEKSVTSEVVYYVENHLTDLDVMAAGVEEAFDAAQRYISAGVEDRTEFELALEIGFAALDDSDIDSLAPADGLLERVGALKGTPFDTADLSAMHDVVRMSREQWAEDLVYLDWLTGSDVILRKDVRLNLIDLYRTTFEEDLRGHAINANELLLPITDSSLLSQIKNDFLPMLLRVPLSAGTWESDLDTLEAEAKSCYARSREAVKDISALVGNTNVANMNTRESLIREYMIQGMTREEAETLFLQMSKLMETYQKLLPETGDSADVLWIKMESAIENRDFDRAKICLNAYEAASEGEEALISAVRAFLSYAPDAGLNYGVLISACTDSEEANSVYEIGDIVIALNGQPCRTVDDFLAFVNSLTEETGYVYTATVLRNDGQGGMNVLELDANLEVSINIRSLSLNGSEAED